jgi:2-oxoglutarate ferredoxin oxidoreductase subunit beta
MVIEATAKQVYASGVKPIWCPGCGDFGVFAAITKALTDLKVDKSNAMIVSGIGCSSAMPQTFSAYGMHSLHGRLLPNASGARLANHDLTVIGAGGDGDGYGIGVGHLIHTARRNINMTYIVMNNETYGLTTGQTSPTAAMGRKSKSTPFGSIEMPVNPLALAISSGATYVARGFSGDVAHLTEMIKGAIQHKGFSLVDVFSPCVTFNHDNTYEWFRPRIYKLEAANHDPSNLVLAFGKAVEDSQTNWEKIPIGVFYKVDKPTYEELDITLKNGPLIKQPLPTKEQVLKALEENR